MTVDEERGRDCTRVDGFEGEEEGYGRDFVGVLSWSGDRELVNN